MATTTQVTSYRSAGQPDDAVGAVGDTCFDTTNRITWVKQSGNTWVGGAYSNIGPTGPAQLSGNGAPSNSLGQNGNGYCDVLTGTTYLKSSNVWAQIGSLLGPQGPIGNAGFSTLTSQSSGLGISSGLSGVTLSSTLQPGMYPGTQTPAVFQPASNTQCLGFSITSPGSALTMALVNVSTNPSTTVFSVAVGANTTTYNTYALGKYPLVAGQNYQWQVSGSGTASYVLTPTYLWPAASSGYNIGSMPTVGVTASQTFSSSATQLKYPGTTVGNSFTFPHKTALYSAQLSNLTNSSLTFTLQGGGFSQAVPANTVQNVGPFSLTAYAYAVGQQIYWTAAGTGTGVCFADTQLLYQGT